MTGPAACDVIGDPTLTQLGGDVGGGGGWGGLGGCGASWERAAGAGLGHLGQPHLFLVVDGADYGFV